MWILNCAECKYYTTEQRVGECLRQGCIIITVAKLPVGPPVPSACGADQDQLGDRQEFNLQILDILPLP